VPQIVPQLAPETQRRGGELFVEFVKVHGSLL
jgi:hypothetical protein